MGDQGLGDQILLRTLRQMGCDYEKDIKSFAQFTPEHVVLAVVTFLKVVTEGKSTLKPRLPTGAAGRHRYCTLVGKKITDLGYQGDASYSQFLYPNEQEVRKMMRWIVQTLPKNEEGGDGNDEAAPGDAVPEIIAAGLRAWAQQLWVFPMADKLRGAGRGSRYVLNGLRTNALDVPDTNRKSREALAYYNSFSPSLSEQSRSCSGLAASLLQRNFVAVTLELEREAEWQNTDLDPTAQRAQKRAAVAQLKRDAFSDAATGGGAAIPGTSAAAGDTSGGLQDVLDGYRQGSGGGDGGGGKGSAFAHQAQFAHEQADASSDAAAAAAAAGGGGGDGDAPGSPAVKDEATIEAERQEQLEKLEARALAASRAAAAATAKTKQVGDQIRQLTAAVAAEKGKTPELERLYLVKKKTLEMLPNAAKHIADLQKICAASAAKLVKLAAEWEVHRRPRIEAIRQHKQSKSLRKENCKRKVAEIKSMRAEMQGMADNIRAQEARVKNLEEQFSKMPQDLDRKLYTYRIMDIIKQVRKQKVEIGKIISNIREVQMEINQVTAKLKRTEAIADERMYQAANDAGRDPAYVQAYKNLAELRSVFDKLINTVQKQGEIENVASDLETKAKQLAASTSARNMERLLSDLDQVRKENTTIAAQLKAVGAR